MGQHPQPASPGIHHVTAIASDPQRNLEFYVQVLGLRLVKKTVNFDDPGSYHFYFGDEEGRPGTILTFFPWPMAKRGRAGSGFVCGASFAVPPGAIPAWRSRLGRLGIATGEIVERFGEPVLTFDDPDGMKLELVEATWAAEMQAAGPVPSTHAIRGFHSATMLVEGHEATARVLTVVLGLEYAVQEGNRFRYAASSRGPFAIVDVLCAPDAAPGKLGAGIVHHLALRARDGAEQEALRRRASREGFNVTPVLDRSYFQSIYFREPGGVLLEVATDAPGFASDEPAATMGSGLMLPQVYESRRSVIETRLPRVTAPTRAVWP